MFFLLNMPRKPWYYTGLQQLGSYFFNNDYRCIHFYFQFDQFGGSNEPTLFDLLMDALEDEETEIADLGPETETATEETISRGGGSSASSGGRSHGRKEFLQTRPCYWSLVSCYRKKRSPKTA